MSEFEAIYESLTGQRLPEAAMPGVEDLSREGTPYSRAWQELLSARDSLVRRFGMDPEDRDLERMLNAAMRAERETALGMYRMRTELSAPAERS